MKTCKCCGQEIKEQKWIKIGLLEWLNEDLGEMNWEEATGKCKELGGRLPTRTELVDLFDNHYEEMIDMLGDTANTFFWSSTTYSTDTHYSWIVTLYYGTTYYITKTTTYKVRCVR